MWYHISNRQNSNSMDLCVFFHLYIRHIVIFLDMYVSCSPKTLMMTHTKTLLYMCICHFDLQTKKVTRPLANTNHQYDAILYGKLWALDLQKLHRNNFFHPFQENSLRPVLINEKRKTIRAHKQKKQTKPGPYLMICIWHFRWSKESLFVIG